MLNQIPKSNGMLNPKRKILHEELWISVDFGNAGISAAIMYLTDKGMQILHVQFHDSSEILPSRFDLFLGTVSEKGKQRNIKMLLMKEEFSPEEREELLKYEKNLYTLVQNGLKEEIKLQDKQKMSLVHAITLIFDNVLSEVMNYVHRKISRDLWIHSKKVLVIPLPTVPNIKRIQSIFIEAVHALGYKKEDVRWVYEGQATLACICTKSTFNQEGEAFMLTIEIGSAITNSCLAAFSIVNRKCSTYKIISCEGLFCGGFDFTILLMQYIFKKLYMINKYYPNDTTKARMQLRYLLGNQFHTIFDIVDKKKYEICEWWKNEELKNRKDIEDYQHFISFTMQSSSSTDCKTVSITINELKQIFDPLLVKIRDFFMKNISFIPKNCKNTCYVFITGGGANNFIRNVIIEKESNCHIPIIAQMQCVRGLPSSGALVNEYFESTSEYFYTSDVNIPKQTSQHLRFIVEIDAKRNEYNNNFKCEKNVMYMNSKKGKSVKISKKKSIFRKVEVPIALRTHHPLYLPNIHPPKLYKRRVIDANNFQPFKKTCFAIPIALRVREMNGTENIFANLLYQNMISSIKGNSGSEIS